jgi:hypothetical protein
LSGPKTPTPSSPKPTVNQLPARDTRRHYFITCGRSYDTPCIHEHACLRCPLLRPDPTQRPRLVEIRDNLHARIAEARREGWLGEVDGLQISLTGARQKLAQLDQIAAATTSTHLGMATFPQIAGRSVRLPTPWPDRG